MKDWYRNIILTLGSLILVTGIAAAQSPVLWTVKAQRIGTGLYTVRVQGKTVPSWRVYASPDTAQGITALQLGADTTVAQFSDQHISGDLNSIQDELFSNKREYVYTGNLAFSQLLRIKGTVPASLKVNLTGFAAKGHEFQTLNESRVIPLEGGVSIQNNIRLATVDLAHPKSDCGGTGRMAESGLLFIFGLGFLGGLLALLTPCVFPMIPLTVSWFMNQSGNQKQAIQKGSIYGFFILLIYLLGSVPFHVVGSVNPEIFNSLSTNIWVNLFFFVLFVIFALSFFGLFELNVSGKITNRVDNKSGIGSLGGIFFMALTLALVSFSCTGPILGSLLVGSLSSNGGAWQLTVGMAGFGLALALPFSLFAMFPGWMQRLPKSGGWLTTVKKVLAFGELAFAFKFLSNADLVAHWGLLKREVFIGIWFILSLLLAIYLFGLFNTRISLSNRKATSKGRLILAVLALSFAAYLSQGLTHTDRARLNLLSGFPPPLSYSIYPQKTNSKKSGAEPRVINDYEAALKLAKAEHKPILIDFTGWACVNCRKMEENVWSKPEVAAYMDRNFILVSLYVDDRKALPAPSRFIYTDSKGAKKEINSIGDKWATFESVNFGQVTQPLYVILNPDEKLMNNPVGYTPDYQAYLAWLKCGNNSK